MKLLILLVAMLVIASNAYSQEFYIEDCSGHMHKPHDQEDYPKNMEWYVYWYRASNGERWGLEGPYKSAQTAINRLNRDMKQHCREVDGSFFDVFVDKEHYCNGKVVAKTPINECQGSLYDNKVFKDATKQQLKDWAAKLLKSFKEFLKPTEAGTLRNVGDVQKEYSKLMQWVFEQQKDLKNLLLSEQDIANLNKEIELFKSEIIKSATKSHKDFNFNRYNILQETFDNTEPSYSWISNKGEFLDTEFKNLKLPNGFKHGSIIKVSADGNSILGSAGNENKLVFIKSVNGKDFEIIPLDYVYAERLRKYFAPSYTLKDILNDGTIIGQKFSEIQEKEFKKGYLWGSTMFILTSNNEMRDLGSLSPRCDNCKDFWMTPIVIDEGHFDDPLSIANDGKTMIVSSREIKSFRDGIGPPISYYQWTESTGFEQISLNLHSPIFSSDGSEILDRRDGIYYILDKENNYEPKKLIVAEYNKYDIGFIRITDYLSKYTYTHDFKTVVGTMYNSNGNDNSVSIFMYTTAKGIVDLKPYNNNLKGLTPFLLSDDGSILFCSVTNNGEVDTFVWTEKNGFKNIKEYFSHYFTIGESFNILAISQNNKYILAQVTDSEYNKKSLVIYINEW